MARGAWYVYIHFFPEWFEFVAKTPNEDDARRVAKIVRGRIRSDTGCGCFVIAEWISERMARRHALDDQIARHQESARRGVPTVEAFAARIAAELLNPQSTSPDASASGPKSETTTPAPARADAGARPTGEPKRVQPVVLWEGAEASARNIRLARTRSAYLEAHGKAERALAALRDEGYPIARRTFYNHLSALNEADPGWRREVQLCKQPAQMHGMRTIGSRKKSRGISG